MPNVTVDDIRVDDGSGDPSSILDSTALAARVTLVTASGGAVSAASYYENIGAAQPANIKASAGSVGSVYATNSNVAVRYLMMFEKASAPVAGDTPVQTWLIPAGTATAPGWVEKNFVTPKAFATGIAFAISTTTGTLTDDATDSEHTTHVEYS